VRSMTAAERAALLSARIHREINAGRTPYVPAVFKGLLSVGVFREIAAFDAGLMGNHPRDTADHPFYRLGAELRSICLGNAAAREEAA